WDQTLLFRPAMSPTAALNRLCVITACFRWVMGTRGTGRGRAMGWRVSCEDRRGSPTLVRFGGSSQCGMSANRLFSLSSLLGKRQISEEPHCESDWDAESDSDSFLSMPGTCSPPTIAPSVPWSKATITLRSVFSSKMDSVLALIFFTAPP